MVLHNMQKLFGSRIRKYLEEKDEAATGEILRDIRGWWTWPSDVIPVLRQLEKSGDVVRFYRNCLTIYRLAG